MASFSFPLPTTTVDQLENLYNMCGVDRAVVLDLASTFETPETVRDGYCGAYLSFFETCGLSLLVLRPILEILAELGLSFSQMCPNLLRHLLKILVRAREEGLTFGFNELRHMYVMKRNNQILRNFLMSPHPGCHVIEGVSYRDEKWREQLFVFKVDPMSMEDFDFAKLPQNMAEDICCLFTVSLLSVCLCDRMLI